jgi:hypothetical protein
MLIKAIYIYFKSNSFSLCDEHLLVREREEMVAMCGDFLAVGICVISC